MNRYLQALPRALRVNCRGECRKALAAGQVVADRLEQEQAQANIAFALRVSDAQQYIARDDKPKRSRGKRGAKS